MCVPNTREKKKEGRKKHTPRLHIHSHNGLGSRLGLALLLLAVLSQTLVPDTGRLRILLLVVRAEQVDILVVVVSSSSGGLGRVQGDLGGIGAVDGVGLGGVAGEGGELGLEGRNVLVPAGGVGVLGRVGGGGDGLEDGDVGLGGVVAVGGGGRAKA